MWKIRATYKKQITFYETAVEIPTDTVQRIKDHLEDDVIDDGRKNLHIVVETSWVDTE